MITCEESFCQERVDCNQTKMDLVANSIQRALTSKCVVKASEQKVREQTSDSETRDSKVLYEAVSQENNQVIASIETQLQEREALNDSKYKQFEGSFPLWTKLP